MRSVYHTQYSELQEIIDKFEARRRRKCYTIETFLEILRKVGRILRCFCFHVEFRLLILPDSWKSEIQKLIDVESQKFEDIEGKKARINKQIIRTMENFEMGFYENKENSYKQKIGILREKLLELQRPTNADIQEAAEIVLSIKGVWAIASDNEKIKMVKMIFKEVSVSIREGKIVWIKPQFGFEKLFSVIPGFVLNENGRFLID
jgi:hypothetical protein